MNDLEKIFNEYYNLIYSIVYRYVRNKEDTEDIISDSFYKAHKSAHTDIPSEKLLPWIIKIAKNGAITLIKKRNRVITVSIDTMNVPCKHDYMETELFEMMKQMIVIVPEDLREPILRHIIDDVPQKKIAREYNIAYSRLRYWVMKFYEACKSFI